MRMSSVPISHSLSNEKDARKSITDRYAKVKEEKLIRPQHYTKNYRQLKKAESRKISLPPREEKSNWLSNTKLSAFKTCIHITL